MYGQFDGVFGNPPYNELKPKESKQYWYSIEAWANKKEANALHLYFIRLAQDLLKDGGMIIYITRASVLTAEASAPFRKQILKASFNINVVCIPQKGTLFENAQTTGMILVATKEARRTETRFIRYINGQEYECSYKLNPEDDKIPLLWHPNTIEIWEKYSKLDNLFATGKGIKRSEVDENGCYDVVDSIAKAGPVYAKTNKAYITKRVARKTEIRDPKVLVSSGFYDADGCIAKCTYEPVVDEQGQYSYTDNVIAIEAKIPPQEIADIITSPEAQIYGSLFRVDRNTSGAFWRQFSYEAGSIKLSKETKKWCKTVL